MAVQGCLVLVALPWGFAADEAGGLRFFEEKIRPLLSENCFECHGSKKQKAGLRLDARARLLKGGESGPAIVPGKPGESLLIEAVSYRSSDLEMPPKKKLLRVSFVLNVEYSCQDKCEKNLFLY